MLHLLHATPENLNSERHRPSPALKAAAKALVPASLTVDAAERRLTFVAKHQKVEGGDLVTLSPVGGAARPPGTAVTVDLSLKGRQLNARGTVETWEGNVVTVRLRRSPHARPPRPRVQPAPLSVVVSFVAQGAGLGRSFLPVLDLDERGLRMRSSVPFVPGTELTQLKILQHPYVLREGEGLITRTHKVIGPSGESSYECGVRLKPKARLAPVDDPADLQRVTHPERVRTILWGLSDLGYQVMLKAGTHVYPATLQHVKGSRSELPTLLCRLNAAAAISGAVSLECTLYGSGYRCFCRVVGTDGTLLKLEPAPVVFEWHRREEERFAVPTDIEATVTFTHPLGGTRTRKVLDLSVTGCSAERFQDEQLWAGLPVRNVRLKLNKVTHAMPDAIVRSAGDTKLGLEFGAMSEEGADAFRVSIARLSVRPIELHDGSGLDQLLELYNHVGLFEGPMAEDFQPVKERAALEWKRAHEHPQGLMRTALLKWKNGVGASSTSIRAYESCWEFEHTAVASASVPASPGQLFGTLVSLAVARQDGDFVSSYVAESAKSLNKVMGEFFHEWSTPEFRGATDFMLWSVRERQAPERRTGARKLTRAQESLVESAASRLLDPVCLRALGLFPGQVTLPKTRAQFAKIGLMRGREAWASTVDGNPTHVMVRSWASPGLCLSSLLNAALILPVGEDSHGLSALVDVLASEPLPAPQPVRLALIPTSVDPARLEAAGLTKVAGCTLYAMHRYALLEYQRFVSSRYGFLHGRFRARPTEAA